MRLSYTVEGKRNAIRIWKTYTSQTLNGHPNIYMCEHMLDECLPRERMHMHTGVTHTYMCTIYIVLVCVQFSFVVLSATALMAHIAV